MTNAPRLIIALDYDDTNAALALVDQLDPTICSLKIGSELFTRAGPSLVRDLVARRFHVFLDLKFHDIPTTVAKACASAAELGVWMLNVHASGGVEMMQAARAALDAFGDDKPLLIAVTVLTSMSAAHLEALGIPRSLKSQVTHLAQLAYDSGLDGVVCSAEEASLVKQIGGSPFLAVTPGIRLPDSALDDQVRVMTPAVAREAGSDYWVVGRPITRALDPIAVIQQFLRA